MPAVHHLPGCGHSTSLPLSFAQDVHIVQMLQFAQLATRKTSLLTLGMHTLHSRLQPLNIFWQPAMGQPLPANHEKHSKCAVVCRMAYKADRDRTIQRLTARLVVIDLFWKSAMA